MKRCFLVLMCVGNLCGNLLLAQPPKEERSWDATEQGTWRKEFRLVDIPSTKDGQRQKAYFYPSTATTRQPLIVSLHTWRGDYSQEDPIALEVMEKNFNYLHPDFRGPNDRPEACGSPLVIADLDDAIRFAVEHGNVDPEEIHVVGASGGGYATLMAFMKGTVPVKSFSAWVPISNLESWYWESVGRKECYAEHILKATRSARRLKIGEARRRSPFFCPYPRKMRQNTRLFLYAGIHDGYTGSVPITQSITMFNKLVRDSAPPEKWDLVTPEDMLEMVTKRCFPSTSGKEEMLGDRKIHFRKEVGTIRLVVFEGGHEQVIDQVLPLIPIHR